MRKHQLISKPISENESHKVKKGEGENSEEKDLKYWKVKVVDAQMIHYSANSDPITHVNIFINNFRWPGTFTVWKEKKYTNIYVGFGIKSIGTYYYLL